MQSNISLTVTWWWIRWRSCQQSKY